MLVTTLFLTGCGDTAVDHGVRATEYDGPLHLSRSQAAHPRAGAAGDVVDCDTWGDGGFADAEVYGDGATADTAAQALEVAVGEGIIGGPQEGLRIARREDDRVLYVLELDGRVKEAVIVRDGPATDGAGGPGWYVESWARCEYAELPRSFTDSLGLQIWTDATGAPVPTAKVQSWTGPEHCDWQSMTFLHLGNAVYVRAPLADLADWFDEPFRAHAELPADVIDTGYERDGRRLWLSPDRRRAYVGTTADVEIWPRAESTLGCD